MSDLEKALESVGPLIAGGYGYVITEDDPIVDAARRLASLTSPETIEKALPEIQKLLHGYGLHLNDYAAKELTEAVLRSVEEGTQ